MKQSTYLCIEDHLYEIGGHLEKVEKTSLLQKLVSVRPNGMHLSKGLGFGIHDAIPVTTRNI